MNTLKSGKAKSLVDICDISGSTLQEQECCKSELRETSSAILFKKPKSGFLRKLNVALRKFFSSKL